MPVLPPWIRAAEPAQYYGQGYGLGLREWEQQAQNARAWNQMAIEAQNAAARQALAEQEMGLRESEFGLAQEELGMKQAIEERKAQEAAQRYSAQQEYQRRVAAGADPIQTLMELGPQMGSQQTAEAAAIRAMLQGSRTAPSQVVGVPLIDPATGQRVPGLIGAPGATGGVNFHPLPGYAGEQAAQRGPTIANQLARAGLVKAYETQISKYLTEMPELADKEPPATWPDRRKKEWQAGRAAIDRIRATIQNLPGRLTNAPAAGAPTMIYNEQTGRLEPVAGAAPTATRTLPPARVPPGAVPPWPAQEGVPEASAVLPTDMPPAPMRTAASARGIRTEDIQAALDDIEAGGFTLASKAIKTPWGKALADIAEGAAGGLDIPTAGLLNLYNKLRQVREAVADFNDTGNELVAGALPPEPVPTEAGDTFD